jgi:general secretion pathway protein G
MVQTATPRPLRRGLRSAGFTLVEILIVVVILGILASIIVPQWTNAASDARESALKTNLQRVRQQLQLYKNQHGDWPSVSNFKQQMTKPTDATGNVGSAGQDGYPFGPYLQNVPDNPATGGNSVDNAAVGSSDWYYNETTGTFKANDSSEHRSF